MPRAAHRLPVAAKTGAATMTPSGMLCTAIARAMMPPKSVKDANATCASQSSCHASVAWCQVQTSAYSQRHMTCQIQQACGPTAKPSGALCSVMVMAMSRPRRISSAARASDSMLGSLQHPRCCQHTARATCVRCEQAAVLCHRSDARASCRTPLSARRVANPLLHHRVGSLHPCSLHTHAHCRHPSPASKTPSQPSARDHNHARPTSGWEGPLDCPCRQLEQPWR